jgi:hypothetical protein
MSAAEFRPGGRLKLATDKNFLMKFNSSYDSPKGQMVISSRIYNFFSVSDFLRSAADSDGSENYFLAGLQKGYQKRLVAGSRVYLYTKHHHG